MVPHVIQSPSVLAHTVWDEVIENNCIYEASFGVVGAFSLLWNEHDYTWTKSCTRLEMRNLCRMACFCAEDEVDIVIPMRGYIPLPHRVRKVQGIQKAKISGSVHARWSETPRRPKVYVFSFCFIVPLVPMSHNFSLCLVCDTLQHPPLR